MDFTSWAFAEHLVKLKCIVYLLSFFVINLFCRIFIFVNQRRLLFLIKKFKNYSCFKAKRLNYSV